ncbi:phosphate ABC transporter substrate-binding protein PstS [Psychromicrobium lacuslunae]|uniref:Phosphate-binding protein n=1 Tax=Psychromicrobium lacuslunae TaxID=1618207 RepID=A0A0D4C1T9_9MICC|nr:phosphate ABC transporter substrate-binding protein PstS [Psychromicrobium lacuslunae]AJT42380.1 phosphate ABC transporter substrate-binding protein [Psychromicrobium lacuslunae]
MKVLRYGRVAAVIAVGAIALTACGTDNATPGSSNNTGSSPAGASVTGTLTGIGASSQTSAMDAWKTKFAAANQGAQVQYSPDGSGAGRKALISGAAQFAGSDAYLKDDELTESKKVCGPDGAIDVPVYISPIAVAYNLKDVPELKLDAATTAKIFRGEIKTWNDPAIAALNSGVTLPSTTITAVHRSDNSGTTQNFTDYLAQAAPEVWKDKASGDWPSALGGENAKGTSGVVKQVTQTDGAITYADESAVGALGAASIKVGSEFVKISAEGASKAVELSKVADGRGPNDVAIKLDRTTTASGVYPVVLVSYQVFCSTYKDQKVVDLVKAFGNYVVSEQGQKDAVAAAKNAPLSASLTEKAKKAIDSIKVGS